jgi:FKBP-type peptidyl-prolyl cis-trans isomerase FkpA
MIRRTLITALLCAANLAAAQDAPAPQAPPPQANDPATPAAPPVAPPSLDPLVVTDGKLGTGKEAYAGATVSVHYTGWLYKTMAPRQRGRKFDSSRERGQPLDFKLGVGQVIKGWDQGVAGMKVGGQRTLIIPSYLAYGKKGASGLIAPDADLIFDVELLDVK